MLTLNQANVTIVGLGLMGGSLALALRPHVGRLTAVDVDAATVARAVEEGIVDRGTVDLREGVQDADVLVLATPVRAILQILQLLPALRPDGCLVLDMGSTKEAICQAMDRLPPAFRAIGGHPMCGKEVAGLQAADGQLYASRSFLLCRTARTDAAAESVVLALVQAIGATPLFLEPAVHDNLVALMSHLPYFVSSLLMQQAAAVANVAQEESVVWQVGASGFRDTTRLAGSDPRMFADIAATNRDAILQWLRRYQRNLSELILLLEQAEDEALGQWLAERQREHQLYRQRKAKETK
jgi:prephenate dehydrogenase